MSMHQVSVPDKKARKQDLLPPKEAEVGLLHPDGWLQCPQSVVPCSGPFVLPGQLNCETKMGRNVTAESSFWRRDSMEGSFINSPTLQMSDICRGISTATGWLGSLADYFPHASINAPPPHSVSVTHVTSLRPQFCVHSLFSPSELHVKSD
jgi:hypothetical protein